MVETAGTIAEAARSIIEKVACRVVSYVFFFNDTATTEIYTLSLHDALPISVPGSSPNACSDGLARAGFAARCTKTAKPRPADRKSTRLNSSHANISYAV